MTALVRLQTGFAFYENGSEAGSTIIGSIDANITRNTNTLTQIRIECTVTGMIGNISAQLRYEKNGTGGYQDVNASSSNVRVASGTPTTGDATTERLAGPNTFVAGEYDDTDGLTGNITVSNSPQEDTEFLFTITIVDADVADNDTLDFRLYDTTTAFETYSITPRITVNKPAPSGNPWYQYASQ